MPELPGTVDPPGDDPVPHAHFRLGDAPSRQRYELWRDSISCIFEVEAPPDLRAGGDFSAEIEASVFDSIMLARTRTLEQRWHRTPALMARDGMDHYMIQLYEHGDMLWEARDGARSFPTDGLVVFDLAQQVKTRTNNFANLSLFIPRIMLEEHLKSSGDQHLRVLTGREPMVQLLRDHMLSLKRLAPRISARQAVAIAPATVGLAAACLNAAVSPDDPRQSSGVAMARTSAVKRFIELHLDDPRLSADRIARQAGMSRSKLYELFEAYGGVARYVRHRRLRRALLALTDRTHAHCTIYEIALMVGYENDAAFIRAFRNRYGVTPLDVRMAGGIPAEAQRRTAGIDRRHEAWVHHLGL
ncbi:helix-turn-helix domain-containing protein [Marinibaculum pumilum]|uniref:Helix-turn-helix domain-containing protein n=1 Tax=Marinibaculum pumilum TaxID=1766165 RepID=A0ABV7L4I1_9PROT